MASDMKETLGISSNPYAGLTSAKKRNHSLEISDQRKEQSGYIVGLLALDNDDSGAEPLVEPCPFGLSKRQVKIAQQTYQSV